MPSEDSEKPEQCRSLNRIFTAQILDSQGCNVSLCAEEDSDQTAWMRRLI